MGNENERKRDPAENREKEMGHRWDEVKTGGDERNVGQTGDTAGAGKGQSVGSGGTIGGSPEFLSGESEQRAGNDSQGQPAGSSDPAAGAEQVLTGDQGGAGTFSGQPQSGTSAMGANSSRQDLGASGAGSPDGQIPPGESSRTSGRRRDEPARSEGGFIGSDSDEDSSDYLQRDGSPQAGFAEQGRGAPEGSEPGGVEGLSERTDNRDTDIEGSSTRR